MTTSDDELLGQLLRQAGARQAPPETAWREVFETTRSHWQDTVRRQRRRRAGYALAGAAALAMMAVAIGVAVGPPAPTAPVVVHSVQVDRMIGTATLQVVPGGLRQSLTEGELALHRGAELSTGAAGGIGLLLSGGRSLRLDAATRLRFEGARRLVLLAGAVYVDSGPAPATGAGLAIVSPAGSVREVGTQFEARLVGDVLRVRVREGRVLAGAGGAEWLADAGEELQLGAGRLVERRHIAAHAPAWEWVQPLAPAPYARDITVAELLDWVSRETGRRVEFARPELSRRVAEIRLHGSPRRFPPMEAMAVMLATTDLGYTVAGGHEILVHDWR